MVRILNMVACTERVKRLATSIQLAIAYVVEPRRKKLTVFIQQKHLVIVPHEGLHRFIKALCKAQSKATSMQAVKLAIVSLFGDAHSHYTMFAAASNQIESN